MEIYREKGIWGEDDVYVLRTMEDWDEYERFRNEEDPDFPESDSNFFLIKEEFRECIGKIWEDNTKIRYMFNGKPTYEEYKVIAIEDNRAQMDWYWVVQNKDDDRDIQYINVLMGIKDDIKG